MDINKLTLIAFCLFACSCASIHEQQQTKEEMVFKGFTFSICLGSAFNEKAIKKDANKSANAYMIKGNMPPEALDASRGLVDKWLAKNYLSKSGKQIQILKCIDLYESSELLSLYRKYTPCNSKANWYDAEDYKRQCLN